MLFVISAKRKTCNSIANKSEYASPLRQSCYLKSRTDIQTVGIPSCEALQDTGESKSRMSRKDGFELKRQKKNNQR